MRASRTDSWSCRRYDICVGELGGEEVDACASASDLVRLACRIVVMTKLTNSGSADQRPKRDVMIFAPGSPGESIIAACAQSDTVTTAGEASGRSQGIA